MHMRGPRPKGMNALGCRLATSSGSKKRCGLHPGDAARGGGSLHRKKASHVLGADADLNASGSSQCSWLRCSP
jgi:hypothetical protein